MNIGGVNAFNKINNDYNHTLQVIASGSKNPSAASGVSDYEIGKRMAVNINSVAQANANTQNTNAMLNVASGAVNNTVEALSSLRENLISAANGTNGDFDRAAPQKSVDQTISQINDNAGVTYNGKTLLDGSQSIGVAGPDGMAKNVVLGNMTAQGLGLADGEGKSTIDLSSADGIAAALDTVDAALDSALGQATSIGAAQQGLGYQSANYETESLQLTDAEGTNGSADIAKMAMQLRSEDTQQQLAMFAVKAQMGMFANRNSVATLLGVQ